METALAILSIAVALFYFAYRFFWGGKTMLSWMKNDKKEAEYARYKSVGWPIFLIFIFGALIIFLFIVLTGNNFG